MSTSNSEDNREDVQVESGEPAATTGSFYRYRRFDDPNSKKEVRRLERERIERMFVDGIVWFAKPSTLNDPFDCKPVLVWSTDMSENRRHIEALWKEAYEKHHGSPPRDREVVSRHVSQVMEYLRTQKKRNEVYWDSLDSRTGVLCLSKASDITQQWTYYAREHTGFCFEVEVTEDNRLSAFNIHYTKTRPQIDMIRLVEDETYPKEIVGPSLLTKAEAWRHECEVRVLQHNTGEISLPKHVSRSVTFGMAASSDDIAWMRKVCKDSNLDIPFYQCVLDDTTFELVRSELNE